MVINYVYEGNSVGKTFIYKNHLDGPCEIYSYTGELFQKDFFRNGKKIYSKKYYKTDNSRKLFKNGKQVPLTKGNLDSLMKK